MARSVPAGSSRGVPLALLYIGIPAYFVNVGFSVWDAIDTETAAVAAVTIAAIAAFTVVFVRLGLRGEADPPERQALAAVIALAVLAGAIALLGDSSNVYLIVTAAMAGDSLRPRLALPIILLATGAVSVSATVHEYGTRNVLTETVVVLIVGLFTLGARRLRQINEELVAAREEVARLAVANERLRFARDLHDLLGHTLTVIRAKSELAARLTPTDPTAAGQEMAEVEVVARRALQEVREAVTGYRRSSLHEEIDSARTALSAAGISAHVVADGVDVPAALDETLGWVVREAVTNVVRHSSAGHCRIAATTVDGDVCLEVADDGRGLAAEDVTGTGLTGVRERLAAVGGTLEVGNGTAGGFRLVARVPAPAPA